MSATRRGRTAISGPRTLLLGAAVSAVGCGLLVGAEPITVEGAGGGNTGGFGGTGAPTSSSGGGMTGTGGTGDGGSGAGGATGTGGSGTGGTTGTGGSGTGGTTGTGGSGTGGMGGGPTCAASLDPVWSLSFTGMADQLVNDIAVDNAGNVVLVGSISGTSDFGGSCPMPANGPCPMDSLGGKDVVIVKLDSSGNPSWTKVTGDSDVLQEATGVATDAQGNIVVTGRFKGSLNFGGSTLTSVSSSTYDIFVAKFAPDGTHLWSKRFGDADDQIAEAVTVDAAGNIILSGYFLGSVYFTSNGMNTLSTAGIYDIFVAKLDPAGEHIWSMRFGDSADQRALGVAVDGGNNVLVTGRCNGTLSFGGPNLSCGPLQPDLFVVKFDPQGGHVWSKSFGDGNDADIKEGKSIAADSNGDVLVTGRFRGTLDFIDGDTPLMTASSLSDVFVTKLAGATGTALWSRKFGASGDQIGESVAADANGNVIVSGAMAGSISFGGKVLASAGATDMFVISYDTSGMAIDGKRYGDSSVQTGIAAKINANNDIILAGNHQGAVDVGCMNNATSVDAYDVIVTRLKHP